MAKSNGTSQLTDQADRERILADLETTLLVEAGAGSGKTTSLVGRLLALIASGVRVQEIAAITFTNKAADEMKERFRLALEKAYRSAVANGKAAGRGDGPRDPGADAETGSGEDRPEPASLGGAKESPGLRDELNMALTQAGAANDALAARLAEALANLDLIFIGTIHSFCGSLLRERPIESGLDPSFEELDEEGDKAFRSICWDESMNGLDDAGRQKLEELLALRVDVNTLREVYERVSYFADVELPCEERPRPDMDRIRATLLPLLDAAAPYIPASEPPSGWDAVQKLVRQSRQKLKYIDWFDDVQMLELAKDFDRKLDVTLNRWTSKEHASEMKKRFPEWQRDVLAPLLAEWREYLYPKLIAFVRPALEYCRERRFAAGKLNFQDLLMEAAKLVRDDGEVRSYFARRYTRLLVDEFQDTDPIQAELMFLLTGEPEGGGHIRDWRKLTPRPGSLFVVGDPKQSIYRFRRADISIYNEVKARIAACGAVLRLTANFRSAHAVGDFVNGQFIGKLPSEETEQQAAFVRMETRSDNPAGGKKSPHGVYALPYPKVPGGKAAVARLDAVRIAAYIAWACGGKGGIRIEEREGGSRPAVPSDFLILTKTREFIHLYAEQLDLHGVPSDTSGSSTVYEELVALWQLARYLDDPEDAPALLGVLRGMLFGISDRSLWGYKEEVGRIAMHGIPEGDDCSEESRPVQAALVRLRTYRDWIRGASSAASAFSRIVDDLGLVPYVSTLPAGAIRAGTLVRMLQLLQSDPRAASSWPALSRAIGDMLADRGLETSSLYAGGGGAVRIMNLHKAKGLEAPVVFLACPCGESDHDATEYIDRSGETARGYFTISRNAGQYKRETVAQPPGWEAMNERERLFANAEKDRLLYVAATRPKQMLVVSLYPEQPANCPWSRLVEGMELMRELDDPGLEPTRKQPVTIAPDLQAMAAARREKLASLSAPSYELASVTGRTKIAGEPPEWMATGKGLSFGSVVHRALELAGKGLPEARLDDAVRMLAEEEGLAAMHVDEAAAVVRNVLASGIWQRSLRAKRRLFEVPLMIRKQSAADEQTLLLRGVIDFLFEEEDGWVIVDFKTDSIPEGKLGPFVDFYEPQVLAYAEEWRDTFGYPVKEAGLYFAQMGVYIEIGTRRSDFANG
ncbi:UvrD-helicase domain-containing protein [Paenibacillus sp. LHD-117]|uniref:UvrD-helicase domain-containing protein n=1 Tax=Paenibacillus sp. LHD-117 TaxID=3071412 RepID=UPI0027DF0DB4|nr:UvrD-helicase domain-containing protein [Paenibacillus sp. LHD-117]MDQ6422874.1 UvrD-helicase domain-containing protein [Paenibacillus sp. LHD-117]